MCNERIIVRAVYCTLSGAGIVLMILFAVICNSFMPETVWPMLVLQYVLISIPAFIAGLTLHRAIKIIHAKPAATLFSDSLFNKFMILAVIMATLDTFYDTAYYGGGDFGEVI